MKLRAVVHEAEEGGYWAEVPALPGCVSQGETFADLHSSLREVVEAILSADSPPHGVADVAVILEPVA
ncbi:MAG: type II toxin-antitoxin system HicB family antitoxin [Gemmatimonadota bacterium]